VPFLANYSNQNECREFFTYDGYINDWIGFVDYYRVERVAAMGICSYRRKKE
jgi:hypothetical protein